MDLETVAVVGVTVEDADACDTTTMAESSTPCGQSVHVQVRLVGATRERRRRLDRIAAEVSGSGSAAVRSAYPGAPTPGVHLTRVPVRGRSGHSCRSRSSRPKIAIRFVRVVEPLLGRLDRDDRSGDVAGQCALQTGRG